MVLYCCTCVHLSCHYFWCGISIAVIYLNFYSDSVIHTKAYHIHRQTQKTMSCYPLYGISCNQFKPKVNAFELQQMEHTKHRFMEVYILIISISRKMNLYHQWISKSSFTVNSSFFSFRFFHFGTYQHQIARFSFRAYHSNESHIRFPSAYMKVILFEWSTIAHHKRYNENNWIWKSYLILLP